MASGCTQRSDGWFECPLDPDKLSDFEEYCRNVTGEKLDDVNHTVVCIRIGIRRESKAHILGPFTLTGKIMMKPPVSYMEVKVENGRYISKSTSEVFDGGVGRGEQRTEPQGSWQIYVRKGLGGVEDSKSFVVNEDRSDDHGKHSRIAAGIMCRNLVEYIYSHA